MMRNCASKAVIRSRNRHNAAGASLAGNHSLGRIARFAGRSFAICAAQDDSVGRGSNFRWLLDSWGRSG